MPIMDFGFSNNSSQSVNTALNPIIGRFDNAELNNIFSQDEVKSQTASTSTYNSQSVEPSNSLDVNKSNNFLDMLTARNQSIPVKEDRMTSIRKIADTQASNQILFRRLSKLGYDKYEIAAGIDQLSQEEGYMQKLQEIIMNPVDLFYEDFVTNAKSGKKNTNEE